MNQETLHKITYGMYIVSSQKDGKYNGQIVNTVFQVTAQPPTIAISINRANLTHDFILASKKFSISILEKLTPMTLIGQFGFKSGRQTDKFQGINYKIGQTGSPIVLDNTLGFIEAELVGQIDQETHTVFIGKVMEAQTLNHAEPMTYAYYHDVKRGKSPATSPTYIQDENMLLKKEEQGMQKYVCKVCGYIYDPAVGDADGGIAAGTPFEKIPDSWVCPVCGVDKTQFKPV